MQLVPLESLDFHIYDISAYRGRRGIAPVIIDLGNVTND